MWIYPFGQDTTPRKPQALVGALVEIAARGEPPWLKLSPRHGKEIREGVRTGDLILLAARQGDVLTCYGQATVAGRAQVRRHHDALVAAGPLGPMVIDDFLKCDEHIAHQEIVDGDALAARGANQGRGLLASEGPRAETA